MIKVTPTQFLQEIFFDVPPGETPLVARPIHDGEFAGRFKQVRPTHKEFQAFSDGTKDPVDWYFGISTVAETKKNTLKRRKQDMRAVYAVVLDDIGTKCEIPPVAPSWVLETSEGNFQYGYMMTTPVENMQWFELFMCEVGKKGFADVGTLDSTRIMRVPMSKNVKEGRGGWLSTLRVWEPDLAYTLPELADQFGFKLPDESKIARVNYITSAYNDMELPDITDPVFEWLQEAGYVRGKQGNGFFEIQCPWHKKHSDGRDEAGYKPLGLGEDPEFRQYKCHHSHDETTNDFLSWVHDQSGIEVGACDRNALNVAIAQFSEAMGFEVQQPEEENDEPDSSCIEHFNFGDPLPIDLFEHRQLVGSGKNQRIAPLTTVANLVALMRAHGIHGVNDVISRKVRYTIAGDDACGEYIYGQVRSQATLTDFYGSAGFRDVYTAALAEITLKLNPVKDYLESLQWDGVSRLGAFKDLFETEREDIRDIVVPAWLAQCVAFAFGENAGGGSVLCLAGRGGIGKTAILQSLVPDHLRNYMKTGLLISPSNKDDIAKACSAWISELGELDGTFRRSDMAALKAFITDEVDSYRPPYGREVMDFKRMTSFAATVNDSLFLTDLTGGGYRRFWVLECDEITWDHNVNIDQLWAEVVSLWRAGTLSRRLTAKQAAIVEGAATEAALYNDDLVIEEFRRLWPNVSVDGYKQRGLMPSRVTERQIIAMLPNPDVAAADEKQTRQMISRLRAYLKDHTPNGKFTRINGKPARALLSMSGQHKWLLPKPAVRVVGESDGE